MAKHLKLFETTTAYDAAESSLILPNVSLTLDNNNVHYNPLTPTPPTPSHDFVEIGGIKWATMNIGAESVTDSGLYFQWGDTQGYTADQVGSGEGQKYFGWQDYKYWSSDTGSGSSGITKYNSTDGLSTLQSGDDAVTAAWGGNWRMPTDEEFQELIDSTTSALTDNYEGSGVAGLVLTSDEDPSKKLFFPVVGECRNGSISVVGESGFYWTSYGDFSAARLAGGFTFEDGELDAGVLAARSNGVPVRGVLDE